MRLVEKSFTESLYTSLKESDNNWKVVKECTDGEIVEKDGKQYYNSGQTFNGHCFKDAEAYEKDRNAVCYITEDTMDELADDDDLVSVEEVNKNLSKYIEEGGVSTHSSICEEIRTMLLEEEYFYEYSDGRRIEAKDIDDAFVEQVALDVFETVDWQTADGYLLERDWTEALEDYYNNKKEKSDSLKESEENTVLNYMLDNNIIIGAEYDHPEEYDDAHWNLLYKDALKKAEEENNTEMVNKIKPLVKEDKVYTVDDFENLEQAVNEYKEVTGVDYFTEEEWENVTEAQCDDYIKDIVEQLNSDPDKPLDDLADKVKAEFKASKKYNYKTLEKICNKNNIKIDDYFWVEGVHDWNEYKEEVLGIDSKVNESKNISRKKKALTELADYDEERYKKFNSLDDIWAYLTGSSSEKELKRRIKDIDQNAVGNLSYELNSDGSGATITMDYWDKFDDYYKQVDMCFNESLKEEVEEKAKGLTLDVLEDMVYKTEAQVVVEDICEKAKSDELIDLILSKNFNNSDEIIDFIVGSEEVEKLRDEELEESSIADDKVKEKLDEILEDIKNDSLIKKYMLDHTWTSGSSTTVYPITVSIPGKDISVQLNTDKNVFNKLLKKYEEKYPELAYATFWKSDGSCPCTLNFQLDYNYGDEIISVNGKAVDKSKLEEEFNLDYIDYPNEIKGDNYILKYKTFKRSPDALSFKRDGAVDVAVKFRTPSGRVQDVMTTFEPGTTEEQLKGFAEDLVKKGWKQVKAEINNNMSINESAKEEGKTKLYLCLDCNKEFEITDNKWPYGEGNCPYCLSGDTSLVNEELEESVKPNKDVYYFVVGICLDENRPNASKEDFYDMPFGIPYKLMDENFGVSQVASEAIRYVDDYVKDGVPGTFGVVVKEKEPYEGFFDEIDNNGWHDGIEFYDITHFEENGGEVIFCEYSTKDDIVVVKNAGKDGIKESYQHIATIYYGTKEDGGDDVGEVCCVVDNDKDFPDITGEDLDKAFKNDNLDIYNDDRSGKEYMSDIELFDDKGWLEFKGKDDKGNFHFVITESVENDPDIEKFLNKYNSIYRDKPFIKDGILWVDNIRLVGSGISKGIEAKLYPNNKLEIYNEEWGLTYDGMSINDVEEMSQYWFYDDFENREDFNEKITKAVKRLYKDMIALRDKLSSENLTESAKSKKKKEDKRVIMQQGNVTCFKENDSKFLVFENENDNEKEYKDQESAMKDFMDRVGVDIDSELKESYGDINPDEIQPDAYLRMEEKNGSVYVDTGIGDHTDLGSGNYTKYPEKEVSRLYNEVKAKAKEKGIKIHDKFGIDNANLYDEIIPRYNSDIEQDLKDLEPYKDRSLKRSELDAIRDITGRRDASGSSERQMKHRMTGEYGKLMDKINSLKRNLSDIERDGTVEIWIN